MDTNKKIREYISAFADGELPDADLELALAALREEDGRRAWDLYHRIGDALRSDRDEPVLSSGFAARLSAKLAAEPVPQRRPAPPATPGEALAAIAPAVVAGADPLKGAKRTAQAAPHDGPAPETAPAAVKRL
ncbi:transcriptional regulator [Massilia sp. UMI-21]|nr:transcriptional regulator [Massilia sp. UMI-21]